MTRRSLKEAVHDSGLVEESGLKAFVFGSETAINSVHQRSSQQVVARKAIHRTFSFTPDRQPLRHYYDEQELRQWAENDIAINGIQSPLWIRPMPGNRPNEFELVAGLRRYLAAEILELEIVPVIIRNWTDEDAFQASLSENANRRDFSPLEHLDGTLKLLALKLDCSIEEAISLLYRMNNQAKGNINHNVMVNSQHDVVKAVFDFLGQTTWQSFVSNRLPLLKKPKDILDAIRTGKLEYTKGLEIAKEKDLELRQILLSEAVTLNLSLSQIRERIKASHIKPEATTVRQRFADTYKRVKQAKIWSDPKKVKRLEKLLSDLEALMIDS